MRFFTCLAIALLFLGERPVRAEQKAGLEGVLIRLQYKALPRGLAFTGGQFSPDGKFVVGAANKSIWVWDAATGKEVRRWKAGRYGVSSLAFSPDGKRLAGCDHFYGREGEHTLHLWEFATGKLLWSARGHPLGTYGVRFSPDGKFVTARRIGGRASPIWDARTGKPVLTQYHFKEEQSFTTVAFSSDGKLWALGSDRKTIQFWDQAKGKVVRTLRFPWRSIEECGAFSPDDTLLFVAGQAWEVSSGKPVFRLELNRNAVFSSDGAWMAQPGFGQPDPRNKENAPCIDIHETATGKLVHRLFGHLCLDQVPAFTSDVTMLVSSSFPPPNAFAVNPPGEKYLRFWDLRSGKEVAGPHPSRPAYSISVAPNGKRVVCSLYSQIGIWKIPRKEPKHPRARPTARELARAWEGLADTDAHRAHQASLVLVAAGKQAVPFLKARLTFAPSARVKALLRDLNSDDFATREKATKALRALTGVADPLLREHAARTTSPEVRRRLQEILKPLKQHPLKQPGVVRELRALHVLHRVGSSEARKILLEYTKEARHQVLQQRARLLVRLLGE